jgi:hypothetical protein
MKDDEDKKTKRENYIEFLVRGHIIFYCSNCGRRNALCVSMYAKNIREKGQEGTACHRPTTQNMLDDFRDCNFCNKSHVCEILMVKKEKGPCPEWEEFKPTEQPPTRKRMKNHEAHSL